MAGPWTATRFPQFKSAMLRLIDQHRELVDEPLHLALSYLPADRDREHIFLFEVIGGAGDSLNLERDLFEATFAGTPAFPMQPTELLHLVLTNPQELKIALAEGWPLAREVVGAIRAGDYEVLYQDEIGRPLLAMLRAEVRPQEAVRG